MSERQESKERRRQGIQSYEGVSTINARPTVGLDSEKRLRVAEYAPQADGLRKE